MRVTGILVVLTCLVVAGMALADDGRDVSMPKNVIAICGANSADIAWEAASGNDVIGYNVYGRISPNGNLQLMNGVPVIGTMYTAQGLSSQTIYDFGVKTVFVNGGMSDMSDLATCATS